MTPQSILVIDDDPDIGELVRSCAEGLGISCKATTSPRLFLEDLQADTMLVVIDLVMPEMDGIELLRILAERKCKAGIVLTSGIGWRVVETAETLAVSLGLTIVGHLLKPFRAEELDAVLSQKRSVHSETLGAAPTPAVTEQELHRAIRERELVLHYQPQLDINQDKVMGLEALVRWNHPEHGLIYPDAFLPRIEELNLMDDMSWLVVDLGLEELKSFSKDADPLSLSINVCAASLRDLSFPDALAALLEKHRMSPECLVLEITESGIVQELAQTLDVLSRLRMKGIELSIDDFGIGYSMMQQLRQIPATELKIDKSFVQKSEKFESDRILVQKMIEIGHDLGMKVVSEGVETQAQMELLRSFHCDVAQGYLISKPMPAVNVSSWLMNYAGCPD